MSNDLSGRCEEYWTIWRKLIDTTVEINHKMVEGANTAGLERRVDQIQAEANKHLHTCPECQGWLRERFEAGGLYEQLHDPVTAG